MNRSAYNFLFPAFPHRFEPTDEYIQNYSVAQWHAKLQALSELTGNALADANYWDGHELGIQLKTYAYSCHAFEWLIDHGYEAGLLAGLSMGLYGALFAAECYDFKTGAALMCKAYDTITAIPETNAWAMASIVGLTKGDIDPWLLQGILVSNVNGEASFLLAGKREVLTELVAWALNEGAFKAFLLDHSAPYHVAAFKPYCEVFDGFVKKADIRAPRVPVISAIDHIKINTSKAASKELIRNLYTPLNWHMSQLHIGQLNAAEMIEVGPGDNLKKIARMAGLRSRITPGRKIMERYANDIS